MPEAGKAPLIDIRVRVRGRKKSERIIALLREHGAHAEIIEVNDDELISVIDTDWYRETKEATSPGDMLHIMRWKHHLTQAELARRIGVHRQNISAIESGKRGLGIKMALKIAAVMGEAVEAFFPNGMESPNAQ